MTYEYRRRPLSYRTSFSEKLFQRTRAAGRASRYKVLVELQTSKVKMWTKEFWPFLEQKTE